MRATMLQNHARSLIKRTASTRRRLNSRWYMPRNAATADAVRRRRNAALYFRRALFRPPIYHACRAAMPIRAMSDAKI